MWWPGTRGHWHWGVGDVKDTVRVTAEPLGWWERLWLFPEGGLFFVAVSHRKVWERLQGTPGRWACRWPSVCRDGSLCVNNPQAGAAGHMCAEHACPCTAGSEPSRYLSTAGLATVRRGALGPASSTGMAFTGTSGRCCAGDTHAGETRGSVVSGKGPRTCVNCFSSFSFSI